MQMAEGEESTFLRLSTPGSKYMVRLEDAMYYFSCLELQAPGHVSEDFEFVISGSVGPGESQV